jgi:HK97 family phage portal protein
MKNPFKKRNNANVAFVLDEFLKDGEICVSGYTSLDKNPEIMTACRRISELIGTITIHLMDSTDHGDIRIKNELSRMIDITPTKNMTRKQWVESFVMTMLLSGRGNSVVLPHTRAGILKDLEPIAANRVSFYPMGYSDYRVMIDGKSFKPDDVLHFRYNPDLTYLWKGQGVTVQLRDVATNLKQASETTKGFMKSKWKPSVIISVDAMVDSFSDPKKRRKMLDDYIATQNVGEPWVIPGGQLQVDTVKPLSLKDLAISDMVQLDKRTVAAVLGVPAFLLGVGEYNKDEWNGFVLHTIKPICDGIQQELTRKLILSPNWYLRFNTLSLMDWDLQTISNVFGSLSDRGFITGNEVRDRLGMSPLDGLDEPRILENYLPWDMSGLQKKLVGNDDQ